MPWSVLKKDRHQIGYSHQPAELQLQSLVLECSRHKDAQSSFPSRQPAVYSKCEAMLLMTYDGATDYTCNNE